MTTGDPGGPTTLRERLAEVVAPAVHAAGFELDRVSVTRAGGRRVVQVVVDRDDGVGLDAVAEVSGVVSAALDAAEETGAAVVPGAYVLEVTSPGVDRPLTEPRHWRRNRGRLVTVPVAAGGGADPAGTLTARVVAAGDSAVTLEVDGAVREVPYDRLGPGRVQVELRPPDELQDAEPAGHRTEPSGEGGT